ncbi:hypothetical protein KKF91_07135 [Myxococcota bacterium]|nr:hypothetical protein [Myxococcota bacterium]MBU1430326.1 hypothetical protein [Myxococcota bacterium]MBU1900608.1 hypothetical protein [Myxococcota bacterium]
MPIRVLLTGGRAPATLELARLLWRGGVEVTLVESLPATVTALSRAARRVYGAPGPRQDLAGFAAALARVIEAEAIDVVIPTCEEIFHVARVASTLPPRARLLVPPLATLRRLHSKHDFIAWARSMGLSVPETRRLTSREALAAHLEAEGGHGWAFKPEFSRFSTATILRPAGLEAFEGVEISPARPWVAQRFIEGRALCSWGVAYEGELRVHACYPVTIAASGAAITFEAEDHPGVAAWTRRFAAEAGLTGQLAFDFIEREGIVYAIECNPRLTSGVHLFRGDARLAAAILGQAPGATLQPQGPPSTIFAALWIYGLIDALRQRRLRRWLRAALTARWVLWSWRDPMPFLLQGLSYGRLLLRARRLGASAILASTSDIEWNGEP